MTTFTEQQEHRDILARHDDRGIGDPCRRWTTCDRCQWESPEYAFFTEIDAAETDHMLWGCTAVEPERVWDDALERWPNPAPWTFTQRIEPAGDIPAPKHRYDPIPFTPRPTKPVIYTDSRPVGEERGAA